MQWRLLKKLNRKRKGLIPKLAFTAKRFVLKTARGFVHTLWFGFYKALLLSIYYSSFKKASQSDLPNPSSAVAAQADAPEKMPRYCVYTTLFGDYDRLYPPIINIKNVDFICFTDQDFYVAGWQMRKVASCGNPIWQAKEYKVLPHIHLAEYDASLFMDANLTLMGDVSSFVERWLAKEDWAMWSHPPHLADCVIEAAMILTLSKAKPSVIMGQLQCYARLGLPRWSAMMSANFMWRRHDKTSLTQLMEAWHAEIAATSLRDQMSLCYLMWKHDIKPTVLPPELAQYGTSLRAHRRQLPSNSFPISGKKIPVRFVYTPNSETVGSTVMRSLQLAELLSQRLGDKYEVKANSDLKTRDCIVVLSKSVLQNTSEKDLHQIKKSNLAVMADWVDSQVRVDLLPSIDVMIACSIQGFAKISKYHGKNKSAYIAHHVDPRIARNCAPRDFSVGYFGVARNAFVTPQIMKLLSFNPVDTITSESEWMERLQYHSVHYSIRPTSQENIYKPFTKGFTAAHCGANIIVDQHESDAYQILGGDYPYMLRQRSEQDILRMLDFARESYGGPEWKLGLDMMKNSLKFCDPNYIAKQFEDVVKGL